MDRQGMPQSHTSVPVTVHMTVQQQPARFFNYEYIKTIPGILKIAQMVVNVLCMCTYLYPSIGATLFHTVAHLGFWVSSLLLVCCLFYIVQRFNSVPWTKIELYTSGIWAVLYILVTTLVATKLGTGDGGYIAGMIFGLCGVIVYGYDAILKLRDFKEMSGAGPVSGTTGIEHGSGDAYPNYGEQPVMVTQTGYPKY